jgi:hypothetical protein
MMTIGILRGFSILRPVGVDVQAHDQVADFKDSSVSKCLGSSMSFQVTHFVSAGSTTREDAGKKVVPPSTRWLYLSYTQQSIMGTCHQIGFLKKWCTTLSNDVFFRGSTTKRLLVNYISIIFIYIIYIYIANGDYTGIQRT